MIALTTEQWVELVLDAWGAPSETTKLADGTIIRRFRRGDTYDAIAHLQKVGIFPLPETEAAP